MVRGFYASARVSFHSAGRFFFIYLRHSSDTRFTHPAAGAAFSSSSSPHLLATTALLTASKATPPPDEFLEGRAAPAASL